LAVAQAQLMKVMQAATVAAQQIIMLVVAAVQDLSEVTQGLMLAMVVLEFLQV
jgi:hypothetical protein